MLKIEVLLLFLLSLLMFSCNKKDKEFPVINIESPADGLFVNANSSIQIIGSVSDNNIVKNVSFEILDYDQGRVTSVLTKEINSPKSGFNVEYKIDNNYLTTGDYFLKVTARDGVNVSNSFVEINIIESPYVKEAILVLSNNSTEIKSVKVNGSVETIYTSQEIINSFTINPRYKQLNVLLKTSAELMTYDLDYMDFLWSSGDLNNTIYPFEGVSKMFNNLIFINCPDGSVKGYDENGTVRQSAILESSQYIPLDFYVHDNYMLVSENYIGSQPDRVEVLYYSSGVSDGFVEVNFKVKGFASYSDKKVFVLGNENGIAKIYTLGLSNYYLDEIENVPEDSLKSFVQTDNNTVFIGIGDKVYKYEIDAYYLSEFLDISADLIKYNKLENKLYVVSNSELLSVDLVNNNVLSIYQNSTPITDVEIQYNK